jgi:hypothetical protein
MKVAKYMPEKYIVRFVGFLRTETGERFKVFSTVSRRHVLMYSAKPLSDGNVPIQSVKLTKLSPQVRRQLGC